MLKNPSARLTLAALLITAAPRVFGQAVDPNQDRAAESEDPILLSPFVVDASEDKGYRASSTLAGTRIKTDLKDVGSAISVVTSQFLQDTGARNNQDLLKYTVGTEVGGVGGNFASTGYGGGTDDTGSLLRPNSQTRVRGLVAADNTRDFFLTEIPWDGYNVDRVDIQRGPNSILFGLGSPAGIINASTNQASFKNSNKVELVYSKYDTKRETVDFNRVLLKDELAIRINALNENRHWRQEPTFQDDRRYYGALRYVPKFLAKNGARTEIRVNAEYGTVKANRPHILPPTDRITPWFNSTQLNKLKVDTEGAWNTLTTLPDDYPNRDYYLQNYIGQAQSSSGAGVFNPWLGGFGNALGGPFVIFNGPAGSKQAPVAMTPERKTNFAVSGKPDSVGVIDGGIEALGFARPLGVSGYGSWAFATRQPGYKTGDYKDFSITDPSIFDFYNQSLDGPNKHEWQKWDSVSFSLSQTLFDNRLGADLSFDHQGYNDGQLIWANQGINVDLNKNVGYINDMGTMVDGTPAYQANPNVGRAYIQSDPNWGNNEEWIDRNSSRLTVFGEVRGADFLQKGTVASIIGRHVFTGLLAEDERKVDHRDYIRYIYDQGYANQIGVTKITDNARQPNPVVYLTGDLTNVASASGLRIQAPKVTMQPQDGKILYFDSHYKFGTAPSPGAHWNGNWKVASDSADYSYQAENPANYQGWSMYNARVLSVDNGNADQLVKSGFKQKDKVTSKAFVWQGFLFDGTVVPVFGYRKDTAKSYTRQATRDPITDAVNIGDPNYGTPKDPSNTVEGINRSYSLVVHTPARIRENLPGHTGLSLYYNKSSNFKADSSRVDVLGDPLAAPSGETKDYGIVITTLDDRLTLKINKFVTIVTNASVPVDDLYKLGAVEAWGTQFAGYYRDNYGADWQWNWDNGQGNGVDNFGTDEAGRAAREASKQAAVKAWYAGYPGDKFYKVWGINNDSPTAYRNGLNSNAPVGLTATGDTRSEGYEFELTAQPTKNWRVSANAAKVTATRFNVGGALAKWVEQRNPVYTGAAGDIRLWWAGSNYRVRDVWTEFYSKYTLLKAQESTSAPEIRPWRFNVISTYEFSDGTLKGAYVGGGYRWEDRSVIGYQLKQVPGVLPADLTEYDVNRPVFGPNDSQFDFWFGYSRRLSAHSKINWRIQLNLSNAFGKTELVPIAIQPNGTMAHYRIREGMGWSLSNTFEF